MERKIVDVLRKVLLGFENDDQKKIVSSTHDVAQKIFSANNRKLAFFSSLFKKISITLVPIVLKSTPPPQFLLILCRQYQRETNFINLNNNQSNCIHYIYAQCMKVLSILQYNINFITLDYIVWKIYSQSVLPKIFYSN